MCTSHAATEHVNIYDLRGNTETDCLLLTIPTKICDRNININISFLVIYFSRKGQMILKTVGFRSHFSAYCIYKVVTFVSIPLLTAITVCC